MNLQELQQLNKAMDYARSHYRGAKLLTALYDSNEDVMGYRSGEGNTYTTDQLKGLIVCGPLKLGSKNMYIADLNCT